MKNVCRYKNAIIRLGVISFVLLWFTPILTQEVKTIRLEKKPSELDFAPHIAGVFDGEISVLKICDVRGIQTRIGYEIMSYSISYCADKGTPIHISGSQIPDSICVTIQSLCYNEELFFTNIKAIDEEGKIYNLSNLRLIAVKEDE